LLHTEKTAETDKTAETAARDKLTTPHSFVPGGAHPRPQKQTKLTDSNVAAVKATTDLARGMIAANIPPHVLQNRYFRRMMRMRRCRRSCLIGRRRSHRRMMMLSVPLPLPMQRSARGAAAPRWLRAERRLRKGSPALR
jgi:hypothetical protein